VHPREVVRACLKHNACAVIFSGYIVNRLLLDALILLFIEEFYVIDATYPLAHQDVASISSARPE